MGEAGLIFLTVKEILNLNVPDPTEVHCVLSVEKQIIRTSTCRVTKTNPVPEWKEGFTFDVTTRGSDIGLAVWGKSGKFPSGKLLGQVEFPIAAIVTTRVVERTVPLLDSSYQPSGVELSFKANYASPSHKVGFDDFIMLRYLGRGTFGKVMLVKKKDTGRLYATKIMRKDRLYREGMVDFPFIERHLLKKFNHPNVVHLKYCFQTETHLYMVMDYISGGELYDMLEARVLLQEDEARFFAAQMVLALGFLHEHDVVYRDLKPENCLLDMRGDLCLIDFGLSKEGVKGNSATSFCGSLQYMAPEILKGKSYGKAVDWWALGVILFEMLVGYHPFISPHSSSSLSSSSHSSSSSSSPSSSDDPSEKEILDNIVGSVPEIPAFISKDATNIIKLLLCKDPALRLGSGSINELRNHPFFAKIHWKNLELKKMEPPLKPHMDPTSPNREIGLDPWASADGDDSNFEILSHSQQEQFKSFSFVAPSELSRSASSPVIGHSNSSTSISLSSLSSFSSSPLPSPRPLHIQTAFNNLKSSSPRLSPRLLSSSPHSPFSSQFSPPRKSSGAMRMMKSPAYYDLSQYNEQDDFEGDHEPIIAKLHISQHRRV